MLLVFASCLSTHSRPTFLPSQDLVNESRNGLVVKAWLCKEKPPSHVPAPRPVGQNSRRSWKTFKWQSSKLCCQHSWVSQHDHGEAIGSDSDVCRVCFGHCSAYLLIKCGKCTSKLQQFRKKKNQTLGLVSSPRWLSHKRNPSHFNSQHTPHSKNWYCSPFSHFVQRSHPAHI